MISRTTLFSIFLTTCPILEIFSDFEFLPDGDLRCGCDEAGNVETLGRTKRVTTADWTDVTSRAGEESYIQEEGMLAAKLTETTADGHRTSEAVKDGSTGRVVAPRAERHDDGCGVVLRWILHGLVSERTGCLSRILGSVDHVANLLIWHDAVDAICRQDEERIPAVIDLPKNEKINLTKLI